MNLILRKALLWQGPANSKSISSPKDVFPSAVYVVPANANDLAQLCDFPEQGKVSDLSEEAFQRSRDKAFLRFPNLKLSNEVDDFDKLLTENIIARLNDDSPKWLSQAIEYLKYPKNRNADHHPLGGWVVTGKKRLGQFSPEFLDDDDSSYTPVKRAITLDEHSRGVSDYARRFASDCGLESDIFAIGGIYHDLGKQDPRFQRLLTGYAGGTMLAKSGSFDRYEESIHQYPKYARHELLSAALVFTKTDDDLLLYLIATHHGKARPFAEPVEENNAAKSPFTAVLFGETFNIKTSAQQTTAWNAELPERFWRVIRKYGWWGAAYREAIFRLADHAQSRDEQEADWKSQEHDAGKLPPFPSCGKPRQLYELPLTGLDGANPLAFLAAIGTLRLANELYPGTFIRWEQSGKWFPVLTFPVLLTQEQFNESLFSRIHRTVCVNASTEVQDRFKKYRKRQKDANNAFQSIKERKLRGKEREVAISVEIQPLREQEQIARREWLDALEKAVPAPFLSLGKSISVTPEEFASFAKRTAERLHHIGSSNRSDADFAPAFGCESCSNRDKVIPSEFQLITGSGQQFFLDTIAKLMETVTVEKLNRVLIGPWTYRDVRLSFRWDPSEDRRYAYSWNDPSAENGVPSEHAANLLAAFALPLFPVIPVDCKAQTTGFHLADKERLFTWPIWRESLSLDVVRSMFQLTQLHNAVTDWAKLRFWHNFRVSSQKIRGWKSTTIKIKFEPSNYDMTEKQMY